MATENARTHLHSQQQVLQFCPKNVGIALRLLVEPAMYSESVRIIKGNKENSTREQTRANDPHSFKQSREHFNKLEQITKGIVEGRKLPPCLVATKTFPPQQGAKGELSCFSKKIMLFEKLR